MPWPSRVGFGAETPEPQTSYRYLLDLDGDLADELDLRTRLVVRQVAAAQVLEVPVGDFELERWFKACRAGPGLLVLDGVIAVNVLVGDRTATELVGTGDLLQPWEHRPDDMLERTATWRVLVASHLALLDAGFAERVRPWPQIAHALLRRAGRRARDLSAQRAIASHPRLEVRLALILWHLAARWGRVEPEGIRLSLPLTHALLGQLVGAERPSVSHALARLAEAGLLTGRAGDWHLRGTAQRHVESLVERHGQCVPADFERRGPFGSARSA